VVGLFTLVPTVDRHTSRGSVYISTLDICKNTKRKTQRKKGSECLNIALPFKPVEATTKSVKERVTDTPIIAHPHAMSIENKQRTLDNGCSSCHNVFIQS
jgi:hypothetical protein